MIDPMPAGRSGRPLNLSASARVEQAAAPRNMLAGRLRDSFIGRDHGYGEGHESGGPQVGVVEGDRVHREFDIWLLSAIS